MTVSDGYTLTQCPKQNMIVITLPQRWDSLTTTVAPISDRREMLTDLEETALLVAVKAMFENGVKMDEVEELNRYIHADKMADELSKVLWCNQEDKKQAVRMVKEFPTADVVEVRHGRWIDDETAYICSVCFHGSPSGAKWNYCPNCGAKMDGEQNE